MPRRSRTRSALYRRRRSQLAESEQALANRQHVLSQTTRENFMKKLLIFAAVIAVVGWASAQDAMKVIRVAPDALVWKDNPNIPKLAQVAVLQGDATKAEVIVQRVKFPANYKVPPHTHPYAENVTVISGRVGLGMGEKFDAKEGD